MSGTGKLLLICHQLASVTSDADRSRNIIPDNFNTCSPLCSTLSKLQWEGKGGYLACWVSSDRGGKQHFFREYINFETQNWWYGGTSTPHAGSCVNMMNVMFIKLQVTKETAIHFMMKGFQDKTQKTLLFQWHMCLNIAVHHTADFNMTTKEPRRNACCTNHTWHHVKSVRIAAVSTLDWKKRHCNNKLSDVRLKVTYKLW